MSKLEQLHNQAMDWAEEAFSAQRKGQEAEANALFKRALALEIEAAVAFPPDQASEPTRSILYRSAASLAYHAQEYTRAQQLVTEALQGSPPPEIVAELIALQEDIHHKQPMQRVIGVLKVADNLRADRAYGVVQLLETETAQSIAIHVPAAQMRTIVRTYFDELVAVTGYQEDDHTYLEYIERVPA
jgi:tetratricopeptide (TPR) repeat protein